MYEMFVWVPTKGWKLVRKFKDRDEALATAQEFFPLETRVSGKNTYVVNGLACMPVENMRPLSETASGR